MRLNPVKCSVMFSALWSNETFLQKLRAGRRVRRHNERRASEAEVPSPRRDDSISDRERRKAGHCQAIVLELSRRDPKIGHPIHSTSASAAFDFSFPSPMARLNYFLERFRRAEQTSHILQRRFRASRVPRRVTHRRTLGERV